MKKIFISQPMRGKTNEEILAERSIAIEKAKEKLGEDVEVIDTFFNNFDGNRLQFLGKSIMEGLAVADVAVFIGDWREYDGCECENHTAKRYKVPCVYLE
jgi:hypothetical protein